MSFSNMKKSRSEALKAMTTAAENVGGEKKSYGDDNIWKPTRDKSGNGYAVIRFLPAAEGEELPWVRYWDHGFQGPTGQWYIENSRTTLGEDDPVSEYNSQLWNSGADEDKELARKQKRRLHYVSNIFVVADAANPGQEGKVMQYKFGKKIFDKIMDSMQPEFDDEEAVNPFDFWGGADFKVKIRKVEGWVNYDKSEFAAPKAFLDGDDAKLETLYGKLEPLAKFTDPSNFKPYAELKAKLARVLGSTTPMTTAEAISMDSPMDAPEPKSKEAPVQNMTEATTPAVDEEDTMAYFAKLANS